MLHDRWCGEVWHEGGGKGHRTGEVEYAGGGEGGYGGLEAHCIVSQVSTELTMRSTCRCRNSKAAMEATVATTSASSCGTNDRSDNERSYPDSVPKVLVERDDGQGGGRDTRSDCR